MTTLFAVPTPNAPATTPAIDISSGPFGSPKGRIVLWVGAGVAALWLSETAVGPLVVAVLGAAVVLQGMKLLAPGGHL